MMSTCHMSYLNSFLRITGDIINRYFVPTMMQYTEDIADEMLDRSHEENMVETIVEVEFYRRARWVP